MADADRYRRPARSTLARLQGGRDDKGRVCGSLPRMLTPAQERAIRRVWAAGGTRDEAAAAAGVSAGLIRQRLQDQLADLPRPGRGAGGRRRAAPPTEHEIAARAAEVRHRWPPERWLGLQPDDDQTTLEEQTR